MHPIVTAHLLDTQLALDTQLKGQKIGSWLLQTLIVGTAVAIIGLFWLSGYLFQNHGVPPDEFLEGAVPSYIDPQPCIRSAEGTIGQFVYPTKNLRITVLVPVDSISSFNREKGKTLFEDVRRFALSKEAHPTIPKFFLRFAVAQVDMRRVNQGPTTRLNLYGEEAMFETFGFKEKDYYSFGMVPMKSSKAFVFVFSPGVPVDLSAVSEFLNDVSLFG